MNSQTTYSLKALTELLRYRDLLRLWTLREVQVRYKQSLLGVAWAILNPLALTAIFTLVFSRMVTVETGGIPYPIFAYTALVPWTFFATALGFGIPSLVNNMNLVTKIYFPREILPLASVGAAFVDFLMASVVFVGLMLVYHVYPTITSLWVIPLVALQIMLAAAIALIGSSVIVLFRDMRFLVPLVTQIWMYATPIIYPVELVPEHWRTLYFLNPMASIIDGYRRALLLGQAPQLDALAWSALETTALLVFGYIAFKRAEPVFADLI